MKKTLFASLLLTALLGCLTGHAQNAPAKPAAPANPAPAAPAAPASAGTTTKPNEPAAAKPADNKAADAKATDAKAADAKTPDTKPADTKAGPATEAPKPEPVTAKKTPDGKKPKGDKANKAEKDTEAAAESPPKKPSMKAPCPIAAFRIIGMETTDTETRRAKALKWLAKNGPDCAPEKLVALRNNRAQWMGAADSTEVAGAIDLLIESITDGNPEGITLLYGTAPPPPKPVDDKKAPPKKK